MNELKYNKGIINEIAHIPNISYNVNVQILNDSLTTKIDGYFSFSSTISLKEINSRKDLALEIALSFEKGINKTTLNELFSKNKHLIDLGELGADELINACKNMLSEVQDYKAQLIQSANSEELKYFFDKGILKEKT